MTQPLIGQDLQGTFKVEFPTPNRDDRQLIAYLESNVDNYRALTVGTPPPENTDPDQMCVSEVPVDWKTVQRMYANDRTNEQTYNYSESFSGDAASYPIFIRDFIVRRQNFTPTTRAIPLPGLYRATVTAPGTGYTQDTVSVVLSGGTGSGGAIKAIVSNGVVTNLIITAIGTYTVSPAVTINDSGVGAGATGTVIIQPATAVLVKEDLLRTPESPLDGLYVIVRRIYETLPGPYIPFTRWDELFGPIQGRRRAVLNTGQVATMTATVKTNYEGREGSSIVSWEIEETNSNGTGSGTGNTAYPILQRRPYDDRARGAVTGTSQLVVTTGSEVSSITETGGVVTRTTYEPFDQFHMLKVVETYVLSAVPVLDEQKFDPVTRTWILTSRKLALKSGIALGNTLVSSIHPYTVTLVETEPYDYIVSWQVSTTWTEPVAIDLSTSFVTLRSVDSYTFPNIIEDLDLWVASVGLLAFQAAFTKRIPHTQRTYWIYQSLATTPPTLTLDGIPDLAVLDQIIGFGAGLPNMIVDDGDFFTPTAEVTVNASIPSATTYIADWIGGDPRTIEGSVKNYFNPFIWRVDVIQIVFEKQISSDYGPP